VRLYSQVVPPQVRTLSGALQGLSALPSYLIWTPMAFAVWQTFGFKTVLAFGVPFGIISAIIDLLHRTVLRRRSPQRVRRRDGRRGDPSVP